MSLAKWRTWRWWAIVPLLLAGGCESLRVRQTLPKDPLFISQRPVAGKAASAGLIALAAIEPTPPPVPFELANRPAYAQRKTPSLPDRVLPAEPRETNATAETPRPPRAAPGILTNRPVPPVLAVPEPKAP